MRGDLIYEERIPFPLVKLVLGLFVVLAILFLAMLLYQVLVSPLGPRPAPDWFWLLMFLWFSGITVFVVNFRKLTITITSQSVVVSFGRLKRVIPWDNVSGCYIDKAPALSYGGWGIRMGRVRGKWRYVYNIIGCSGIVLELNRGRFREFVFSTRHPAEILKLAEQRIQTKS